MSLKMTLIKMRLMLLSIPVEDKIEERDKTKEWPSS